MPIERIALINKGFAKMSVQRILLTVLVLALPALGYTQASAGPPARASSGSTADPRAYRAA